MDAESTSVKADETRLVKSDRLVSWDASPATSESPYVYGYDAAAEVLRAWHAPYATTMSLKSICSKIRCGSRFVPHFPLPAVNGQTVIFDRRRLIAWAIWKNGGPDPTAIYRKIDVAESRREVALRRIAATAERELEELLSILATTEHDGATRLSPPQLRTLVRRFKHLLFEYDWDFDGNTPRGTF